MRFTAAIACLLVAHNCAKTAAGLEPQNLFSADALWIWWVASALWVISAMRLIISGAR